MIRQQVGDVLEIKFENNWFYLVVLTKIVQFGGNIVFAFHNDGKKMVQDDLLALKEGFNICTDLLWVKREGLINRIGKVSEINLFYRTRFYKWAWVNQGSGQKADWWYIVSLDNFDDKKRVKQLTDEFKNAMDSGTYSFDLVAKKVLQRYTPDQDDRI